MKVRTACNEPRLLNQFRKRRDGTRRDRCRRCTRRATAIARSKATVTSNA